MGVATHAMCDGLNRAKISGYRCAIDTEERAMDGWKIVAAVMFLAMLAPAPVLASNAPPVKSICAPGFHPGEGGYGCIADSKTCDPGKHLSSSGTHCLADQPPKVCKPGYHLSHNGRHCLHDW